MLPGVRVRSLVEENGNFRKNWRSFLCAYLTARIDMHELENEMEAQFRKVLDSGLNLTHVNSHEHLHLLPSILDIVIRLSRKYNVSFIRCPYVCLGGYWFSAPLINIILQFGMNIFFCIPARKKIIACGLNTSRGTSGKLYSGILDQEKIRIFARAFKDGLYELICHPVSIDVDLDVSCRGMDGGYSREYETLCSGDLNRFLEEENICLVSFLA